MFPPFVSYSKKKFVLLFSLINLFFCEASLENSKNKLSRSNWNLQNSSPSESCKLGENYLENTKLFLISSNGRFAQIMDSSLAVGVKENKILWETPTNRSTQKTQPEVATTETLYNF